MRAVYQQPEVRDIFARWMKIAQIFRLLKPGGFFVSSTACLGESWIPFKPLIAVMRWMGKAPPVVEVFSKATLRDEVRAAGFVDLEEPEVGVDGRTCFLVARKGGDTARPAAH